MRILAIAASTLAILLAIGLATDTRAGASVQQEISNSSSEQMSGPSAPDVLFSGANAQVVRAPQRKRSEPRSIVALSNAEAGPAAPISCALATKPLCSEVSRIRFSRFRI